MGEFNVHESLVCCAIIIKVEGHDTIVIVAMIQHKAFFGSVQRVHTNLIIPRICIHEAQRVVA